MDEVIVKFKGGVEFQQYTSTKAKNIWNELEQALWYQEI
jgi:Fe-S cluster biosynthesis and repair protein YggX